jgi:hypothetical protein
MNKMNAFKNSLSIFGLLIFFCVGSVPGGDIVRREPAAKLDLYLTRITPFGFSGAVLLAKGEEILLNKGYGLAIRAQNIPNSATKSSPPRPRKSCLPLS